MFVNNLIDRARRNAGIPSDNQLAIRLNVSRYALSMWRNGKRLPDEENTMLLAELAGVDAAQALLTRTHIKKRRTKKGLAANGGECGGTKRKRPRQLAMPLQTH